MKSNSRPFFSVGEILKSGLSMRIKAGYEFAAKAHEGRLRFSGKPYLEHVVSSANIILNWIKPAVITSELQDLVIATLLHDTIEYEDVSAKAIQNKFGTTVKNLVIGVSDMRSNGDEKVETENLKYIAKKGYLDPRVFVIKLADRLHNMRTHEHLPKDKQVPKAMETMNVYVPLAESMGMWIVKKELEDICFSYIHPSVYANTVISLNKDPRMGANFDRKIIGSLVRTLGSALNYHVSIDVNGVWTIYKKRLIAQTLGLESKKGLSHIPDAKTVTVTTDDNNLLDLYKFMGTLHTSAEFNSKIVISEIKDYIAAPQPNRYSALQTTLNLPEGKLEVAFTTRSKKEFNDLGIVALLKNNINDLNEYKLNIIFDENRNAWFLPVGACYLDYAYHIGIGPNAKGILVNGVKKKLSDKVRNGSVVNILLSEKQLTAAKYKKIKNLLPSTLELIQKQLNLYERNKLILEGKQKLESVLRVRGILDLSDVEIVKNNLIYSLYAESLNDLYLKIAFGSLTPSDVVSVLDRHGVTKAGLGFTTLRVSGNDKPGILNLVTETINKFHGNIYKIDLIRNKTKAGNRFSLRLLIRGIETEDFAKIRIDLTRHKKFQKIEIC